MYLLGYDIGSSTIKVALIHADTQQVLGLVQHPEGEMEMIARQSGWAEQHPEVWWQHCCTATQRLLAQTEIDPQEIRGIGIAYQMHGLVLVDRNQQVLRPAIIWCDSRAVAIGQQAFEDLGQEYCLKQLLNSPGNFTASKLRWVKDNEPQIYEQIHKVLLPGDYIAMKLTQEATTTLGGLTEGVFWDFQKRQPAHELLKYFDLDANLLATPVPTFSQQACLSREAARQTGLAAGTPVTYRAGDQPNNAVALNVLHPGEVAATSGSSGVVYGIVDRPMYDPQSRVNAFAHVNYENHYDRIGMLLCINGAGSQYSWMKHQIARSGRSYEDMERMLSAVPVGSSGVCVVPFGNGAERIFNNRHLNAQIFNLQFHRHSRAHLYRASLEGVAFSFVYGVNLMKEMGLDVDVIRVANDNMFRSKVFSMTIATLLGSHIEVVDTTGAIGAARAAGVAAKGVYSSLEEALISVEPSEVYEPRLNYALCSQAYHYWLSCLNRVLNESAATNSLAKRLRARNQQLKKGLQQKNKDLANLSHQLISRNEILSEVVTQLQGLSTSEPHLGTQLRPLIQKLHAFTGNDEDWNTFQDYFDLISNDFFKKMKVEHADLNNDELKLALFLRMKLSTKEIASRLNLSIRGVETRRYRLRKKLRLSKGVKLIQYLKEVGEI